MTRDRVYRLVLLDDVDNPPALVHSTNGKVLQAMGQAFAEKYCELYVSLILQQQDGAGENWKTVDFTARLEG